MIEHIILGFCVLVILILGGIIWFLTSALGAFCKSLSQVFMR